MFVKQFILVTIACYFVTTSLGQTAEQYYKAGKEKEKTDKQGAIAEYTKAIATDPKYIEAYSRRAYVKRFDLKDHRGAIDDYTKVIYIDPKNKYAYLSRGQLRSFLDDIDDALEDFNKAIAVDANFVSAYSARADIKMEKLKDINGALDDYNKAIAIDPEGPGLYSDRGSLKQYMFHDYEGALADYNKSLELDDAENKPDNLVARSTVYTDMGKYLDAINDCEQALKLNRTHGMANIAIIFPLAHLYRFTEAAAYYDSYNAVGGDSEIGDHDFDFLRKYFDAIFNGVAKKDYVKALSDLQDAEKLFNILGSDRAPDKTGLNHVLTLKGYVLEKLSRNAEALDTYNQALIINARQPEVKKAVADLGIKMKVIAHADVAPPTIELISPQPSRSFDIVSDNNETQIIGKARDLSGIASVKINGFKVGKIEDDGLFIAEFSLKPGENNLEIIATDKQGNIATKTFRVTGNLQKKENVMDIPVLSNNEIRFYAVLIAEQDYQDQTIPDLSNPIKDARELKAILESQYGFSKTNIDTFYNRNREDIMQGIVQRCNTLTENDNLLIFYAGHGTAEKDKFGDVDGYWIPVSARKGLNASYISADDINKALKRSDAKHIMVVADACFSGAFTRQLPADASLAIQKQYALKSRKVMASGNLEPVPDNSKFIYYLKKNLKENKEKYLSAKKLFDGFYEAILNNSENTPQYAAIKNVGDEGGEFVFIKK